MLNIHSSYLDKRIAELKSSWQKSGRWSSKVIVTTHEQFIQDYSDTIFTNLIKNTITPTYMKKHPCSDCGAASEQRTHGIGEERPILIKRALEKVLPDTSVPIVLREIIVAFLEEHKYTKFTLKCTKCHAKEPKAPRSSRSSAMKMLSAPAPAPEPSS